MKQLICNLAPLFEPKQFNLESLKSRETKIIQFKKKISSKVFYVLTFYLGLMLHKSIFLLPFSQMVGKIEINVYFIAPPSAGSASV